MRTIFTLLICLFVFYSFPSFGQPGTLDVDFDSDGKVTTDFGSNNDFGLLIAIQPDGKILVAGFSGLFPAFDFALVRYNTDGTLDNTFGSGGKVTTDFASSNDFGNSVAVQPDGKILVAGYSNTGSIDFAIVRYLTDGSLDSTFGSVGRVTTAIGSADDFGLSVAIQADGKIVVTGFSDNGTDDDFALVRYNTDGTLDNTFDVDGKVTTAIGSADDEGWLVAVQSDGKILVVGTSDNGSDNDFAVVRYNTDGSLDNTFSVDGRVTTGIGSANDAGRSVAIQPDGKILVAGISDNGSDNDFAVVRYNTDGTLDNTFSVDGIVTTDFGNADDEGRSVTLQPDGKILVAGRSHNGTDFDFALVRYNTDGTLDNTFSLDGKVTTGIRSDDDESWSVAIGLDGKILVAGYSVDTVTGIDFAVARYISGLNVGLLDFSAKNQSPLIYPNPIQDQTILEYTLTQEERITVRLVDISGKVIKTFIDQESRSEGEHREELDFPNVSAGNYLLVIDNGDGSQSIKIIIQ